MPETTPLRAVHVWTTHVDGSSNKWAKGAGVVLMSPYWRIVRYSLRFNSKATNNEALYESILAGLSIANFLAPIGFICTKTPSSLLDKSKAHFQQKAAV